MLFRECLHRLDQSGNLNLKRPSIRNFGSTVMMPQQFQILKHFGLELSNAPCVSLSVEAFPIMGLG